MNLIWKCQVAFFYAANYAKMILGLMIDIHLYKTLSNPSLN